MHIFDMTNLKTIVAIGTRVKQLGHEPNHSPPFSAEVKNAWNYTSTSPLCLHGMVLQ
jgi:hypothetical protein